jgi:L-asparaginase
VVTGAMNNSSHPDYDGPQNLRNAVACAASADLRGQGALVALDGRLIGADVAVKTHATAKNTFQAREGEPVGTVLDGVVRVTGRRQPTRLLAMPESPAEPVYLVIGVVGMDGTPIRLLGPTNPAGLVVSGAGTGNTHPDVQKAAFELRERGTYVVLTTRSAYGAPVPVYAFPGGGATWLRAGVPLSPLPNLKARIAIAFGLSAARQSGDDTELRAILRA